MNFESGGCNLTGDEGKESKSRIIALESSDVVLETKVLV